MQYYCITSFRAQERVEPTEDVEVEKKVAEHKLDPTVNPFAPTRGKNNHHTEQKPAILILMDLKEKIELIHKQEQEDNASKRLTITEANQ